MCNLFMYLGAAVALGLGLLVIGLVALTVGFRAVNGYWPKFWILLMKGTL